MTIGDCHDSFLFESSNYLCLNGYKFIKKCHINASLLFHKVLEDHSIMFFDMKNNQLQYLYKNKNDSCTYYLSNANFMQCKHEICLIKKTIIKNWKMLVEEKQCNPIFK